MGSTVQIPVCTSNLNETTFSVLLNQTSPSTHVRKDTFKVAKKDHPI